MSTGQYDTFARWELDASAAEVHEVLRDAEVLRHGWPYVALRLPAANSQRMSRGGLSIQPHPWLRYRLELDATVEQVEKGRRLLLWMTGHLEGVCDCRMVDLGEGLVVLTFACRFEFRSAALRWMWWLFRPAVVADHQWIMRQGRESLQQEIDRRRTARKQPLCSPSDRMPESHPLAERI